MLEDTTQTIFFILLAILMGIIIGYFLAKTPHIQEDEEELETDLHVDAVTGIVSDDSLVRGKR